MTRAVRRASETLAALGVESVIAHHGTRTGAREEGGVAWRPVRHVRVGGHEVPVGLGEVLQDADLLVLHSAWTAHNVVAGRVARRLGVPYLLEPRGAYDPHIVRRHARAKRLWWIAAERELVQHARAVHVFFDEERAHVAALGATGPVVVAPNGVDDAGVRWQGRRDAPLVWLGRFDPEHKGLDLLLDAVALLPRGDRPQVRLHGPDWRQRKALVVDRIRALGLGDHVEVAGPVHGRAKHEAVAAAAGFVYPSRWEAFGNSAAEAAVAGVPMALTPYPLARMLADRSAAVVRDASASALADGLLALGGPEAPTMGDRAAAVARDELSWPVVSRAWLRQVEAVL